VRGSRRGAALVLALCAGALLGVERPPGLGDVLEIRHWSYDEYTRVVVELSREVESRIQRLPADPQAERPERLYVDLEGIWVGRRYGDPIPVGDGLLRGVRVGQNTLRRTRVVLDLQQYDHHRVLRLSHPERVVIDVYGAREGVGDPGRNGSVPLPLEVRGVQTVVLDPGHGGADPGAIGVGGLREKDVTLELARRVAPRLRERGFLVVLTREGDRTLSLEERTAIAAGSRGDLFVSLHANAAPRRGVRGVETYYLDTSNERQSLRVAARENGMAPRDFDLLDRTLVRLRMAETSSYSALLARTIQGHVVQGVGRRYRGLEDLGVKQGPFYVLFLSSMPSVLVEVGFVTHREEARRLRSGLYLDHMAESLARALSTYRAEVGTRVARGGS